MHITSLPFTGYHQEEFSSVLFTSSHKVFINIDQMRPELQLLEAQQCQLSQPLLIQEMLQCLKHLHGPLLGSLQ